MRLLSLVALLILPGCLFPFAGLSQRRVTTTVVGEFELVWAPNDFPDRERSVKAITLASPKLTRWGTLNQPVTFYLLPSHLRLESAVRRFGYGWLHAWARYDEVYFQAPRTWGASDEDLNELVLHELTHCVMYQRSGTKQTWGQKQIPLWFREGMATWTANQGHHWSGLEDLARYYDEHPDADPLARPDELYKDESGVVYAAAHHGFTFLIRRFGAPAVKRMMESMAAGLLFPEAFEQVTGITAAAFTREFRLYVVWRGFRGHGQLLR